MKVFCSSVDDQDMKYKKDIKDWTKQFAVKIVQLTIELKKKSVDYSLRDQLLRAGTSVGSNVKEAKASSSRRELIRFYEISLRSCNETEFWFEVIQEGYKLKDETINTLQLELTEISNVIAQIIINLKK